jgi:hypothetical protein
VWAQASLGMSGSIAQAEIEPATRWSTYFGPVERRLEAGRLVLLTDARRFGVCLSLAESCW